MDLKYSTLAHLAEFSNDKVVDMLKRKIAESDNAALSCVFDDSLLVLDEENEDFYTVKYTINDNGVLKLFEWEKVNLTPDDSVQFESILNDFFDVESKAVFDAKTVVESFQKKYSKASVNKMINETTREKRSIATTYPKIRALNSLRGARHVVDETIVDLFEDEKINAIYSLINENSATQNFINRINFKANISVPLIDVYSERVISTKPIKESASPERKKNIKSKIQNLWRSESFKKDLKGSIKEMEDVEDVTKIVESFIAKHKEIILLSESEFNDLILKTSLIIGEAKSSNEVVALFSDFYNLEATQSLRESFLERNNLITEEAAESEEEIEDELPKDEKQQDEKETSIDEDSINKIISVLSKIKDNLEEKTLEYKYVESFIQTLEDAKVGSISEGKLKDILDFLNSIFDASKSSKEEEEE